MLRMAMRKDARDSCAKWGTHSFADVFVGLFGGAVKLLLHSFLEEIDTEL